MREFFLKTGPMLSKTYITREISRNENLRSYQILDTPSDENFNNITKLAASICKTPVAAITFLEEERQWIKSCVGLDMVETPRKDSFCAHAVEMDEVMVVEDPELDERFRNNPYVAGEPFVRFYAGAQIKTAEGFKVGSLCVVDFEKRTLTSEQRESLELLAAQVSELLSLRKLNLELNEAQKMLQEQQDLLINKARHQTIGELVGGVCHQINNPLAIIVGRSMILRSQLKNIPDNTELLKELDVIDQTSHRVSGILKALRTYSRDLGQEISSADLNDSIEDALTLLKSKIHQFKVDVEFQRSEKVFLQMNRNQIGQVILDLLSNSLEAMEDCGQRILKISLSQNDTHISLDISDTGSGMTEEERVKIFEPFFSTKPRHFGVGLSNARNFVRQHGGELRLVSLKNPTIFRVKLPKSA